MQLHARRVRILPVLGAVGLAATIAGCDAGSPVQPSAMSPSVVHNGLSPDGASAMSADRDVPFKGRLEGVYTLEFPAPLVLSVSGQGTGNATQLGQFTFQYDEIVDLSTGTGTGTYVFTAANGDTLTVDWTGLGFPTPDPDVLSIVENATITGGTGRFAHATGTFRIERLFNFVTSSGGGSFAGTIRLQ